MSAAWLDLAKEELAKSDEWKLVMNSIYESVQASLKRNKTKHFADLTAEERAVVMAQVELELTQETAYTTFLRAVSRAVDTHLAVHVDSLFVQPSNHATKQTLAMQTAADAAGRLVQSLPLEQRSLLRLLFNQPFPPSFRRQAWRLFLADPTSRFKYEQLCLTNRISTISVLDTQLTHQSQAALEAFPSLPNTRDTLIVMKTALSYLHTCNSSILQEMDAAFFKLILPLLAVWLPEAHVSSLVEAYSAFLALPRPKSRTSCDLVVGHVVRRLDAVDPSIARSLTALFPTEIPSSASWLGILQPYVDYLFVGIVKLDVLLFIWDQCFLVGHDRLLPELCAAVLALVLFVQSSWPQ
ncbi:hypothetical protein AC1031_003384 [Aphanomyces cochlioides]|nr:hypothetical protein AC1031_003384 [Aphanomyces cochlioides]